MTRQQFEVGIQRLYYVAWAGFSLFYLGVGLFEMSALPVTPGEWAIAVGFALLFTIAPLVLMHLVRWVYRGFIPK